MAVMNRLASTVLAVCVSGGLLCWAFWRADLRAIAALFGDANFGWIAVAYALVLSASVVHCQRWSVLLRLLGYQHRFRNLLNIHFAGVLCNTFLPAQLGIDVARVQFARHISGGRVNMLVVVAIDRLVGALALSVLGCVAWGVLSSSGLPFWLVIPPAALLVLCVSIVIASTRLDEQTSRRLADRLPLPGIVRIKLSSLFEQHELWRRKSTALFATVGWALFQTSLLAAALAATSHGLHLPIPPFEVAITLPLIAVVTMTVPISINGLGVREAMFCLTMIPLGLNQSQALALAAAWFALVLTGALPGIVGFVNLSRKPMGV